MFFVVGAGLAAAVIVSALVTFMDAGFLIFGVLFGVFTGLALLTRGLISRTELAILIVSNGVGYLAAYSLARSLLMNVPDPVSAFSPQPIGALASVAGAGIVLLGFAITRRTAALTFTALRDFLLLPALIGGASLWLAVSIDNPGIVWPDSFGIALLIHGPWQAVFAGIIWRFVTVADKSRPQKETA